jgi:hypothetical protein
MPLRVSADAVLELIGERQEFALVNSDLCENVRAADAQPVEPAAEATE